MQLDLYKEVKTKERGMSPWNLCVCSQFSANCGLGSASLNRNGSNHGLAAGRGGGGVGERAKRQMKIALQALSQSAGSTTEFTNVNYGINNSHSNGLL